MVWVRGQVSSPGPINRGPNGVNFHNKTRQVGPSLKLWQGAGMGTFSKEAIICVILKIHID